MKHKKHVVKSFFKSRFYFILTLFILELAFIIVTTMFLSSFGQYKWITTTFRFLSVVIDMYFIIYILNSDKHPRYKLAWILLVAIFQVLGVFMYLIFADKKIPYELTNEYMKEQGLLVQDENVNQKIKDRDILKQYISTSECGYPYYLNSALKYFSIGEEYFEELLKDIDRAEHFIFLEYFIVKNGEMLDRLVEKLSEKVKQGVKVYLMYDDGGSLEAMPDGLNRRLNSLGINVAVFGPVKISLLLLSMTNHRDHRKIVVIDNKIAYSGGVNIGDEYINAEVRFGCWKDSGIRVEGECVRNFTLSFIQFYNFCSKNKLDYKDFLIEHEFEKKDNVVLPFVDSPTDNMNTCKNIHLNMINSAKDYIYMCTPYLVIDEELENALINATKSNVDVRILVPYIPDKKSVFMVTRSHYSKLVSNGVRIYEYTPGFVHAKDFVCDDSIGLVGTVNMDFRSYYLHYECGFLIHNNDVLLDVKDNFLKALELSHELTMKEIKNTRAIVHIARAVMNVFAPLL